MVATRTIMDATDVVMDATRVIMVATGVIVVATHAFNGRLLLRQLADHNDKVRRT